VIRIALVQKRVIDDEIGVLVDYFARKRPSPLSPSAAPTLQRLSHEPAGPFRISEKIIGDGAYSD
jgi:hypothetical protein